MWWAFWVKNPKVMPCTWFGTIVNKKEYQKFFNIQNIKTEYWKSGISKIIFWCSVLFNRYSLSFIHDSALSNHSFFLFVSRYVRYFFTAPYSKISFDLEPFKDVINYNTNIEFGGEFVDFDFFFKGVAWTI